MNTYPTSGDASELRFAVVVSRFNHPIGTRLLEGCTRELERRGADPQDIDVAWVPGAFEIPLAARALAESGRYDALVTLGCVIRGGTPHFDYVCRGVTDGVRAVTVDDAPQTRADPFEGVRPAPFVEGGGAVGPHRGPR